MTRINASVSLPSALLLHGGRGRARVDGYELNVNLKFGSTNDLVFLFHGAVDRKKRALPFFQPFLLGNSHLTQISICDDSLFHSPDAALGIYQGHETLPLKTLLPKLIDAFCIAFESQSPPLFVGGSSGGYAALYYSNMFDNSTAIVANPQTNMKTYTIQKERGIEALLRWCWTNTESAEALSDKICTDLSEPYSLSGKNRILYLQNASDHKHLHIQMGSFIHSMHKERWKNFTAKVDFWGKIGHSSSIPYSYISEAVGLMSQHPSAESDELLKLPFFNSTASIHLATHAKLSGGFDKETVLKTEILNKTLLYK